jgi:hypothetical protein
MSKLSDYVGAALGVDLAAVPTPTIVTITNTGGQDAIILSATPSLAGVMLATDKDKLDNIAPLANRYIHPAYPGDDFSVDTGVMTGAWVPSDIDINLTSDLEGHVTDANGVITKRQLTLADLGYTGDTNANDYTHPSYTARNVSMDTTTLSGAQVISRIQANVQSDDEGHVTSVSMIETVRTMTAEDLGATSINITGAAFTPVFIGASGGSTSGLVSVITIGNMVCLFGRIAWTTAPTGTGQVRIGNLPYSCTYATGGGAGFKNVENQANAANGSNISLEAGETSIRMWRMNENGVQAICDYNDLNSSGFININLMYYASSAPT